MEVVTTVPAPIRKFADSGIQEAVRKVMDGVPAGKKGAVVAVADGEGAKLAVMAKLSGGWSVVMVGEREWGGKLAGQAAVVFHW